MELKRFCFPFTKTPSKMDEENNNTEVVNKNTYMIINYLAYVLNVIDQTHGVVGARNVILKNLNKILIIGLVGTSK
jgi:hypothetical protein